MYSCILYSRCIAVYDCIAIQWARPHACVVYSCIIHTFLYNSCRKRCIRLTAFLGPRPEIQARATTAQLAAASWSLLREEAKQSALDQPRRDLRLTSPEVDVCDVDFVAVLVPAGPGERNDGRGRSASEATAVAQTLV